MASSNSDSPAPSPSESSPRGDEQDTVPNGSLDSRTYPTTTAALAAAPMSASAGASPIAFGNGVPAQYGETSPLPKRRNVVGVWLGLPIITLGIYPLVWWYKINRETRFSPRTQVSPFISLIAVTLGAFLIIPPFVSIYRAGQRIAEAQRAAGLTPTCTPVLGLVLAFIFSLYSLYYRAEMNKIPEAYPGAVTNPRVPVRGA